MKKKLRNLNREKTPGIKNNFQRSRNKPRQDSSAYFHFLSLDTKYPSEQYNNGLRDYALGRNIIGPKPDHPWGPWCRGPGARAWRGLAPLDAPLQNEGKKKIKKQEREKEKREKEERLKINR